MTITIYKGDVLEQLRLMPDDSVDCIFTSPPYWGLRDYGTAEWSGGNADCLHRPDDTPQNRGIESSTLSGGKNHTGHKLEGYKGFCPRCGAVRVDKQMGLEPSLADHLAAMMTVFNECRRVLKPSGTCWVNYGDCYATSPNGRSAAATKAAGNDDRTFRDKPFSTIGGALKPKDLCMMPNRFAIAMQDAGWWVRSEIVWAKPNAMPESVRDRPATAHEKIFMFTKSARYYWNKDEARMPSSQSSIDRWDQDIDNQEGSGRANGGAKTNGKMKAVGGPRKKGYQENANGFRGGSYVNGEPGKRTATGNIKITDDKQSGHGPRHAGFNDRWDQMTKEEQSANGRNLRNYEPAPMQVWEIATSACREAHFATFPPELVERGLKAGCPVGGLVLDPFSGSGTTGLVADYLGMNAHLIELNGEYIKIAWNRLKNSAPLTMDIKVENMELFP